MLLLKVLSYRCSASFVACHADCIFWILQNHFILTLANSELLYRSISSQRVLSKFFFFLFLIKQLVHEKGNSKHRTLSHLNINITTTRIAARRIQCVCIQCTTFVIRIGNIRHRAPGTVVMFILLPFKLHATCFEFLTNFYLLDFKQLQRVLKSLATNSVTSVPSRTSHHHHHHTYHIQRFVHIPRHRAWSLIIQPIAHWLIRPFAKWIWLYIDASSNANTFNSMLIALHTTNSLPFKQYWAALDLSFHFTYRTLDIFIYYRK